MSFSRSAVKRFNEETGCAPPVGHYHPKYRDKQVGSSFDRSKRFSELDGASDHLGPPGALSRTQSDCSTRSTGIRSPLSSESSGRKARVKTEQDYLNTIKSLREEIAYLRQKSATKQRSVAGSIVKCKGGHDYPDAASPLDVSFLEDVFFSADSSGKEPVSETAITERKDACVNTSLESKSSGKSEEIASMMDKISKLEAESQRMTSSLENLEKKTVELEVTAQKYASLRPRIAKYQAVLCELLSDTSSKIASLSSSGKPILKSKDFPQVQNFSLTSHQAKCLEQLQELSSPHLDTSDVHARVHRLVGEVEVLNAVTGLLFQQNRRTTNKLAKENLDLKSAAKELRIRACGKAVDGALLRSQESQIKILQSELSAAARDLEKRDNDVRTVKDLLEQSRINSELMLKEHKLKEQTMEESTIKYNKTIEDLEKALDEANILEGQLRRKFETALEESDALKDQLGSKIDWLEDRVEQLTEERSRIQKELDDSRARVCEVKQLADELKEELSCKSVQQDSKSLLELENLKMEVAQQKMDIRRFEEENQLADKENSWKSKFEELEKKVAPFRDQLDGYARERDILLLQYSETSSELAAINEKYARSMGHQNHKQKIRYVEKLQTEINQLRQDLHQWQQKYIKQQSELESLRRPQHGSSHNTPVKSKSTKSAKP